MKKARNKIIITSFWGGREEVSTLDSLSDFFSNFSSFFTVGVRFTFLTPSPPSPDDFFLLLYWRSSLTWFNTINLDSIKQIHFEWWFFNVFYSIRFRKIRIVETLSSRTYDLDSDSNSRIRIQIQIQRLVRRLIICNNF